MKVSLVILTFNRWKTVQSCLTENLARAGHDVHEIIHVDNGSSFIVEEKRHLADLFKEYFRPEIQIRHRENLGVAKGYNRGLLMATGSHVVITGCDRIMPAGWLKAFVDAQTKIPSTGVISCYSHPTATSLAGDLPKRYQGVERNINGVRIIPAMACEARFHSKEFLHEAGLFREDFGLYGYEDVEWVERAKRVARENGLLNYILPDLGLAEHIVDDDEQMPGGKLYGAFKNEQNKKARDSDIAQRAFVFGNPYYNPYVRDEQSLPDVFDLSNEPLDEITLAHEKYLKEHMQHLENFVTSRGTGSLHSRTLLLISETRKSLDNFLRHMQTMRKLEG